MKKQFIYLSGAAFILLMSVSCNKETPQIPATGLTLSKASLLINEGTTDTIIASVIPEKATNNLVTWVSSDQAIVKVDDSGVIEGVAPGVATITATTADGHYSATCSVNTIKWTIYNTGNGLADNSVYCIAVDSTGHLWFGGSVVSEFYGSVWYNYPELQGVGSIDVDAEGKKWFGSWSLGVYSYDGTNFTHYDTTNCGIKDNAVIPNAIDVDLHGNIWFGTMNRIKLAGTGVSRFDGTSWKTYSSDDGLIFNNVWDIETDALGNVWFVTSKGISEFDGSNWTSYTSASTGIEVVDYAVCVAIDSHGNKWFGTQAGLLKFDGISWTTFTVYNSGLVSNQIHAVALDKNEDLWIGAFGGVSKFDGTSWTTYNAYNGLTQIAVMSIAVDKSGNKWIGTTDGLFELQD